MKAEIWEALSALKKNNTHIELVQKAIEEQDNTITDLNFRLQNKEDDYDKLHSQLEEMEEQKDELEEKLKLPGFIPETMEDEMKNAILLRLRSNLTLQQLEQVENFGKGMIPPGIQYRD